MRSKISHTLPFGFVLAVLLAGVLHPATVSAQQDGRLAVAEELMTVMDMETVVRAAAFTSLDVQIRANPAVAPFRDVMESYIAEALSWESIGSDLMAVYVDAFTEEELRDMVDFYRTPTGQKLIGMQQELMRRAAAVGEAHVQANQAELQRRIMKVAQELQGGGTP